MHKYWLSYIIPDATLHSLCRCTYLETGGADVGDDRVHPDAVSGQGEGVFERTRAGEGHRAKFC